MITAVNDLLDDLRGGRMAEEPIVQVEQGRLQGKIVASPSGKHFYSFQGVPYAKPPLGSLRFKAPQSPEPWEDIRDATSEGNVSAQVDPLIHQCYVGDENCLFLNVYTPNLDGEFLPVMVYIHGGGYKFGSGSSDLYGGDYLVERDVVVVTLNYRCGPLGFLSLNTPEVPGNAGLKDIVQAIRWIKENIKNFGGNSGNLTIFGESAGGAAVSIMTASPLTKNLISKAIIQSGTGLNSWAFQKSPIDNAKKLAKALGCGSDDIDEILEFLSTTPVKEIVEVNDKINPRELFRNKGLIGFGPVVEKEFEGVEAVITESFIDILTSGRTANVPIMIGSTSLEFAFERSSDDLQTVIPDDFHIERNSDESIAIANKIERLYFTRTGVESLNEYFELLSDRLVNIDTHRYVKYLVKVSNKPIYYYKFDYVGELNLSGKLLVSLGLKHAAHMDELGYIFRNKYENSVVPTPQDIKMRERMLRLWTNFAKSGNPTPDENHYLTVTWLPVTKDNLYCLNLSNELSVIANPDKEKMDFWDSLYNKYFKIWDHPKTNTEEITRKSIASIVEHKVDVVEDKVDVVEDKVDVIEDKVDVIEDKVDVIEEKNDIVQETLVVANEVVESNIEAIDDDIQVTEEPLNLTETIVEEEEDEVKPVPEDIKPQNGIAHNGTKEDVTHSSKISKEIKMAVSSNGHADDVIRANDPPEDDLPKNIGVNKFVNFFESLGGKK